VCNPDLTADLCKDDNGYMKFVELANEHLTCRGKAQQSSRSLFKDLPQKEIFLDLKSWRATGNTALIDLHY
jgi:hypothetical protein